MSAHRALVVRCAPSTDPEVISPDEFVDRAGHPATVHDVADRPALALRFDDDDDLFGYRRTSTKDLCDVGPWARQLAQAICEVTSGHRSPAQLVRHTTLDVQARLSGHSKRARRLSARPGRRPRVGTVLVDDCRDGVAEVSAVIWLADDRAYALAFRLVGRDGRWVVDALHVG